jgi:CHAT domain-containing protein
LRIVTAVSCGAILACAPVQPATAETYQAILQRCKDAVSPQVQSCMQSRRGTGDRESNLAACREAVTSTVRACVNRESQRAAAGKAAPATPKGDAGGTPKIAISLSATFVAPPRTIADITEILDKERPDSAKLAKLKSDADMEPPRAVSASQLAQFYNDRGNIRALIARNKEALADGLKALEVGKGSLPVRQTRRIRQFVGFQYLALGDPKQAVVIFQLNVRDANQLGEQGGMINASRFIAQTLLSMGDVAQAETYARRVGALVQEARGSPLPGWRSSYSIYGNQWEADADTVRALVLEARGQYREAEQEYRRAEAFRRAALKDLPRFEYAVPPDQILLGADNELLSAARVAAKQGLLSQAEADARRALLGVLQNQGKYNPQTPKFIVGLAGILVEQGRFEDAEKLARSALEVQHALGIGDDTPTSAGILSQLGGVLTLQRKDQQASDVYAQLDRAIAAWEPRRREVLLLNGSRISALYASGQIEAGISAAQELVKRQSTQLGSDNFETAAARGVLAIGYARAGRDAEAIREFQGAIPVMIAATRENADDEDAILLAARNQRLQASVESFIGLLARTRGKSQDLAIETFALADAVRGRSVQQALTASSARMTAKEPALAELARTEQDLGKQISGQLGMLNNVLALPSSERDENLVAAIKAQIEKLRADRNKARQDINRQFPSYADLIDPKPPSVDQIKASLRQGEALISFYFGRDGGFVWAVPKEGDVAFAAVPITATDLELKIRKLRDAVEPQQVETIADIPPFDLPLAHEIYALILKPVEAAWKPARSLIVVTNGALGLLPLSVLPTERIANVAGSGDLPFAAYRKVPWLARSHAVTMVPSVAALRALRQLPQGSDKREPLIGFGDPYFSAEQAAEAQQSDRPVEVAAVISRGLPLGRRSVVQTRHVDSADLALLPRLPDTADELKSIALSLQVDPSKVLFLGKDANEGRVKGTDLSRFRIIAFATHGLVPGDLNGLTQPALALSAPSIADLEGDGLLTMEEILALKLDSDWVVLSACNTGTGAGAGAEAVSGLGRAFFYAGTRTLLVTNWAVHSASARELVTGIFARQASDAKLARAEALRQAMLAVMDGPGYAEGGKTFFAYAHPMFWAPYTIVGDGGGSE